MKKVIISNEIRLKCPTLRLGCISCDVEMEPFSEGLWEEIIKKQELVKSQMDIEQISSHPVNAQTRDAYRACGKKPGRYRPSAEALMRRVLQGKDLYRISNVVDMINLTSFSTGFSIGGYDGEKIDGDIILGIGNEGEPYEGLGRGVLNIHKLPVFRDDLGAFGSPTSDSERTGVTMDTNSFLMIFLDFGSNELLETSMEKAISYLKSFCGGENVEKEIVF